MIVNSLPIEGLFELQAEPFVDTRGSFARIFCADELKKTGLVKNISQINISKTVQVGAVRGMHYQLPPYMEAKIVRCLRGSVFDVAVDLRRESHTFLKWYGQILDSTNMKAMLIPEGFAHGFQVLEADSELLYFHTENYNKKAESAIRYDDPMIGIEWPLTVTDLSERDRNHLLLAANFTGV